MIEHDWLTQRFAEHRGRLTALAYRMLGSRGDAEDAMQESWLRVSRADGGHVENPAGWLTTVVARVCLNMLESRRARRRSRPGRCRPSRPSLQPARPSPGWPTDRPDPVPDEIWDEAARHYDEEGLAALLLSIATTNVFNRLNVPTRQIAGAWG
jgi:DNA-directed RNA polymerase specialized sigma24 family protein